MTADPLDLSQLTRLLGDDLGDDEKARVVAALQVLINDMRLHGGGRGDPMREIFSRLGDRWSVLILLLLRTTGLRHAALRRLVAVTSSEGAISQRMLTLRLRDLERDGLVLRSIEPTVPPRVSYALSPIGADLLNRIEGLMDWVREHNAAIRAAQSRFDADPDR